MSAPQIETKFPRVAESERPLSPHLSIYKPQLTSGMSIFHKITGIGIAGGLTVMVIWLIALAMGPRAYTVINDLCVHPIGQIFFIGWSWALFYHLCCGIRHLLWAVGWCLTIRAVYISGYIALAVSAGATLGLWALLLAHEVPLWQ